MFRKKLKIGPNLDLGSGRAVYNVYVIVFQLFIAKKIFMIYT